MNHRDPDSAEARRLAELGLLTAGLIHELRQPLFGIKALAQLLEMQPERLATYLPQLLGQVEHMETLLRGYSDFSRRPGPPEVFDVQAAVRSAQVILEHRARQRGVRLEVVAEPGALVRGSMLAVQQVLVNLGENALDAVRGRAGGGVRVLLRQDTEVILRVEDDGPGIPEPIRATLFEPFRTTKTTGTGLGLSISRDLVNSLGGTLVLVDGPGTIWEVRLPAATTPEALTG